MTQLLQESLGELPSGKVIKFSSDAMSAYIRNATIENDGEDERKQRMRLRLDLYQDRGDEQINDLLGKVFKDAKVRDMRKAFLAYARYQNVTKRVINEISTVYSEAAMREVSKGNKQYQELLRILRQDRKLRKVNRFVNLLNECLVMFRVSNVDLIPTLDIITPDQFYAIAHPLDPAKLIAVMFSSKPQGKEIKPTDPHWVVWSAAETFRLDRHGRIISDTYRLHPYGRIPGELVHREIPDSRLLDPDSGEDLIRAHKAVDFLNILMMKEQKSGTRVPYVVGDIGQTAMGQAMDTESLTHFEEGINPGTLDLGADPRTYIDAVRAVIKQIASNYGIPESVFDLSYQATSGFEIELKRVGLREKRRDQIMDYRDVERVLVEIQAAVMANDLPEQAFGTEGWGVDFGEVETPQDPMQRLLYWEKLRQMSLTSTVDMAMEINPEFTKASQAGDWIKQNIELETLRVMQMRELQQLNGSMGSAPGEPSPEENGAAGLEGDEDEGSMAG